MTLTEARRIINKYEYKSVLTEDEEFLLLEAMEFMIDATKETEWMVRLGGYHYEKRNFDLALKYYEMADELFYLLREPVLVTFMYGGDEYEIESVREDGGVCIRFEDRWYRDIDDFFAKATIDGERIPVQYRRLSNFKVV